MVKEKKAALKSNQRNKRHGFLPWLGRHRLDATIVICLMIGGGIVSGINMTGYPQRFEDEGTYISQAWEVEDKGTLTNYTYWYDHPPLGWIQMAAHLKATDALNRHDNSAISAGREFMLLLHIVVIALLYGLARRLKIGRAAAAIGVLLYALSPLAVEFSRYVFLDNVALPWILAALLLALSPKKHIFTAVGSAACLAIAVLSKETFLVLLPVVIYALWRSGDKRNRRYTLTSFFAVFLSICGVYLLYAALKKELFPGVGHVSLLGTLSWQLFGRAGSGSIFSDGSGSRGLVGYWLGIDFWLLLAGAAAMPIALFLRNLRIAGLSLLIGLLMLLRTGYLPYPYIIMLLPFAALTFSGAIDLLIFKPLAKWKFGLQPILAGASLILLIIITFQLVIPDWEPKIHALNSVDQDQSSRQAISWIAKNIPRDNKLVVESALWTDLLQKGYDSPTPIWLYKTETDPAVKKSIGGWQGVDYVVLNGPTVGRKDFDKTFPTVSEAIKESKLTAEFGQDNQKILVYKVNTH